jgi:predicted RNA methylase
MKRNHLRLVGAGHSNRAPNDGIAFGPSPERVARAIRSGLRVSDRSFDQFLPAELRRISDQHWTPLAVALRVASALQRVEARTVVDIGSGAGKFCVAAAVASRCTFIGLEQRLRFVEVARSLARTLGVDDRVEFLHGALNARSIPVADAYYLYNPFGENLYEEHERLGDDVELSPERHERDVALVEDFFEHAPAGTYVIEYNGFGGRIPRSYEQVWVDRDMRNELRMWRKGRAGAARGGDGAA